MKILSKTLLVSPGILLGIIGAGSVAFAHIGGDTKLQDTIKPESSHTIIVSPAEDEKLEDVQGVNTTVTPSSPSTNAAVDDKCTEETVEEEISNTGPDSVNEVETEIDCDVEVDNGSGSVNINHNVRQRATSGDGGGSATNNSSTDIDVNIDNDKDED